MWPVRGHPTGDLAQPKTQGCRGIWYCWAGRQWGGSQESTLHGCAIVCGRHSMSHSQLSVCSQSWLLYAAREHGGTNCSSLRGSLGRLPEEMPFSRNLNNEWEFARSKEIHTKGSGFKVHHCHCVRYAPCVSLCERVIIAFMLYACQSHNNGTKGWASAFIWGSSHSKCRGTHISCLLSTLRFLPYHLVSVQTLFLTGFALWLLPGPTLWLSPMGLSQTTTWIAPSMTPHQQPRLVFIT